MNHEEKPDPRLVFVFGSNTKGRHGAGAAKEAREKWGAVYGQGEGLQGRSYAIPTKDDSLRPRSLAAIQRSVDIFLKFARDHPDLCFQVTRIGCGLAGYSDKEIAPMFHAAPENCSLPPGWGIDSSADT